MLNQWTAMTDMTKSAVLSSRGSLSPLHTFKRNSRKISAIQFQTSWFASTEKGGPEKLIEENQFDEYHFDN